jgi:hypothetical protein
MHYQLVSDPDARGRLRVLGRRPSVMEALRLAWRLWRQPDRYAILVHLPSHALPQPLRRPGAAGCLVAAPLWRDDVV